MATGVDAGEHGVYGFRCASPRGPGEFDLTDASRFSGRPPIWVRLAQRGMTSRVIGLPGTWPSNDPRIIPGILTPHDHPGPTPGYRFDVADFRQLDAGALLREVTQMTQERFDYVEAAAAHDDWNLLWVVEIGLDRLHHALWHHVDPRHPRFTPDSDLAEALEGYYGLLDRRLGGLVAALDDGETAFVVVSDHGARPMHGGIRINEWLRERGWLVLREEPAQIGPLQPGAVDWDRTRAWTTGGYCARIYLEDSDPELAQAVSDGIRAIRGPRGERLETTVHAAASLWPVRRGRAPDLVAYLGRLDYRCLGSVGAGPLHQTSNDTGPDAANHDWEGIFVAGGPGVRGASPRRLLDVSAWLEGLLGV